MSEKLGKMGASSENGSGDQETTRQGKDAARLSQNKEIAGEKEFHPIRLLGKRIFQMVGNSENDSRVEENFGFDYAKLSENDSGSVLSKTIFKSEKAKDLVSEWAAPKCSVELKNGTKLFYSDFLVEGTRPFIVTYIEDEKLEALRPRLFYASYSSGLWRFCPRMLNNNTFIDKGPGGEDSLNAPFEVQKILDEFYRQTADHQPFWQNKKKVLQRVEASGIINELADGLDVNDDLREMLAYDGWLTKGYYGRLIRPEECIVSDNLFPDFSHEMDSWTKRSSLLQEDIINRCFESEDKSLQYLFSQTKDGRAWIAAIECQNSKMNSLGIKSEFAQPGSIAAPLYEYGSQACGYGNQNDRIGPYVGMDKYINRIPAIKEFQRVYRHQD